MLLVSLQACSPVAERAYFCETQKAQLFDGFVRQYTVQLEPDRVCVSWQADVLHCGLFQKETSTTWVVDQSTGTKAQFFYQASRSPGRVELTIKQQEVLLLESTEAFTRATVTGFQFSENVLLLAVSSDPKDSAGLTYACSTWRKKPWWAWT
ncbi:MAG: hypothetical protein RL520_268 [Pseudomonadota bacterium]